MGVHPPSFLDPLLPDYNLLSCVAPWVIFVEKKSFQIRISKKKKLSFLLNHVFDGVVLIKNLSFLGS